MSEIIFSDTLATQNLRGKVVVLTGGAQGIGAATVTLLHQLGAHIFFGDLDTSKALALQSSLTSSPSPDSGTIHFLPLDVTSYSSQLSLFDLALSHHPQIDIAIQLVGVPEPPGNYFSPSHLNLTTVRDEPLPLKQNIDINLTSVILFSRIALAYLSSTPGSNKSIILTSSIAGITEAPGLFSYSSAKHGVIGLMRSLRRFTPSQFNGIRVNAICPWATDTQMLGGVKKNWEKENMPMNTPKDVAKMILQCAADETLNGKAVFVGGGRGFDTEEGIDRTLPEWMGKENAEVFLRGQEVLGLGGDWVDK
ncbi:hypothetical protein QBC38DRAFT_516659 [Podospora fimiseda]|uniref:Uncharacterized protein n=1 Tax=Podospora fimiseda TaxID=252190 RepID=A0AAN7GP08_9PEZI|nr:hypothetical protein QBC38DRAFT_516659 [Podospora fimiseda]